GRPVEAGHAVAALDAHTLDHDVVAGFGVIVGIAVLAVEHVVAHDGGVEHQLRVLASKRVEAAAAFDPVVACFAEQEVHAVAAQNEVIADPAHYGLAVGAGDQEVVALIAEDQRKAATAMDDVVAFLAMKEVSLSDICAGIGDDVVTLAAMDMIDAVAALEPVVALPAPDRVVAFTGYDVVVSVRALDDDMLDAVVAEVVGDTVTVPVLPVDQFGDRLEVGVVVRGIVKASHGDLLEEIHVEHAI